MLTGLLGGTLLTGGVLGGLGYWQYKRLSAQNSRLSQQVKRLEWRNQNLNTSQSALSEELERLKQQHERAYDQTLNTLLEAADTAGIRALYETGLKAWEAKDVPNAYFALSQVHKLKPDYAEMNKRYPPVQKAYAEHQQRQRDKERDETYAKGLDAQRKQDFAQARTAFQRVLALQPGYKDADKRLKQVSQALATQQQAKDQAQKKQWLEATYKLGLEAQKLGRYAQAKMAFEGIVSDAPGYKDSAQRLKSVSTQLAKAAALNPGLATSGGAAGNCYSQGVLLANCARSGNPGQCTEMAATSLAACKNHPDFKRGMQSVNGGQTALSEPDDLPGLPGPDTGAADNLSLLKSFPDYLKNL
ncbi:MAG: hypothetical protein IGS03_03115 [Candidatus Sericytochromatia bacterium]|nr:hypothetical protein [Candidatus Sericytochromatia bacterium]